jgi:hypothetical protein
MTLPTFERLHPHGHILNGMASIGLSFPDAVVAGDPQEKAHVFYDQPLKQATVGVWESEPGVVRFDPYPFDEMCIIVEGEVALSDVSGATDAFRAGDIFIVRRTFRGHWTMPRRLRKFYVELKA